MQVCYLGDCATLVTKIDKDTTHKEMDLLSIFFLEELDNSKS